MNTGPTMLCKSGNDRRSSMDLMISKRLSLGMGNDQYILPSFSCDFALDASVHSLGDPLSIKNDPLMGPHKRSKCEDLFEPPIKRKKRRMNSLDFLTSAFFEENRKGARRDSLASIFKQATQEATNEEDDEENIDDSPLTEDDELDISLIKEDVSLYFGGSQEEHRPVQRVDPEQVKNLLGEFKVAMERSQKSQQDIHDWDRKMGLKRSHSKTMRLSSRSRKKLRTLFKNEITALLSKYSH